MTQRTLLPLLKPFSFGLLTAATCFFVSLLAAPAAASVADVSFDDAPGKLPIDTRFSQSIQTVAFDLGLTCGQIEAYGWNIKANDQNRVDAIFTNTAVALNDKGYRVQPQNPASAAEDITVYTATQADADAQHKLFVWSAGDAGLLLLVCDAKGTLHNTSGGFSHASELDSAHSSAAELGMATTGPVNAKDLIGVWEGTYNCRSQGRTGGKLTISSVKAAGADEHTLNGVLDFYPADGNTAVERGSYKVSGTFSSTSQQAYLEPGKWLKQPKGYIAKPIIAYFDVPQGAVSAIFQDTTGCTSFEARLKPNSAKEAARQGQPVKKKPKKKKLAPKPVEAAPVSVSDPVADAAPQAAAPSTDTPPASLDALAPLGNTPVDTPVTVPATPPASAPASTAPESPTAAPAAPTPAPSAPAAAPVSPSAPASAPAANTPAAPTPFVDVEPVKPAAPTAAPSTTPSTTANTVQTPAATAPSAPPSGPIVVPNKTSEGATTPEDALAKAKAALEASEAARATANQLAVPAASEPRAEIPAVKP